MDYAIVMPFLRANVIPVNPQIHANVMRPVFVLNFIFEPLFVHVPDIVHFLKFLRERALQLPVKCTRKFVCFTFARIACYLEYI
jgi:hypothetical protein